MLYADRRGRKFFLYTQSICMQKSAYTSSICKQNIHLCAVVFLNKSKQNLFSVHKHLARHAKAIMLLGLTDTSPITGYKLVPYFFDYKTEFFCLPKQHQRSRSILQDRSRSLGLFRKGKIGIIAKFHRTDLVI